MRFIQSLPQQIHILLPRLLIGTACPRGQQQAAIKQCKAVLGLRCRLQLGVWIKWSAQILRRFAPCIPQRADVADIVHDKRPLAGLCLPRMDLITP